MPGFSPSDKYPQRLRKDGNPGLAKITAFNCPNCGAAAKPDWVSCVYCHASISTRVCPTCFHAVAVGMRHCQHCGAEISPLQPVREIEIKCLRCSSVLQAHPVGQHSIPVCPQCGGIWLDKSIFRDICSQVDVQQTLLDFRFAEPAHSSTGNSPTRRSQQTYIHCPECGKLMAHKSFAHGSGVVLDWCRSHGVWLDRQELHHIAEFIRKDGMRKHNERELAYLRWREKTLRSRQLLELCRIQEDTEENTCWFKGDPYQYEIRSMQNAIAEHQNTEPLQLIFRQIFGKL